MCMHDSYYGSGQGKTYFKSQPACESQHQLEICSIEFLFQNWKDAKDGKY